jgi:uncharacterized protein YndB with AHSA1/START domain
MSQKRNYCSITGKEVSIEFRLIVQIITIIVFLGVTANAQNQKLTDSLTMKDFRVATEKKMVPKSAVDATSGLLLVNAEVSGTLMQTFLALTTNEVEKWWKLPDVYYLKDWKVDARVGGKWSVDVEINGGKVIHEWGEFCKIDPPNIFIKTKKMDANPFVGERETTVTFRFEPSPFGTLVTIREEGFIGLPQAAFGTAENWEKVLGWLDSYLLAQKGK